MILPAMLAAPAPALAGGPGAAPLALSTLEPGQWDFRSRDPGEPTLHLCIRDMLTLLQLRHRGQVCSRYVLEDGQERTSIAYNCPKTGHGRTELRVETSKLIQIDSQGVADGYPFAMSLEGRRVSACPPMGAVKK